MSPRPAREIEQQLRRLRLVIDRIKAHGTFDTASELALKSILRHESDLKDELNITREEEEGHSAKPSMTYQSGASQYAPARRKFIKRKAG